ncbi:4136_t:CDS:10, partial [Entrophospora sp. SA101]
QDTTCDDKISTKLAKTPSQATSHLVGVLREPLNVDMINWEAYTDIIYGSNQFDQTYISSLVDRANKSSKKVHVLAAVGNYGKDTATLWINIRNDQKSFTDPIINHIRTNDIDGVDIEYPQTECTLPDPSAVNLPVLFANVLEQLRAQLGVNKTITATFGPNDYKGIKLVEQGAAINALVDWVNVIGYRLNIGLYPKQVEGPTSPFKDNPPPKKDDPPPKKDDPPPKKDDPPTTNDLITFKEVTDGWKTTGIFANKLVMGVEFSGIVRKVNDIAPLQEKTQNVDISTTYLTFPNSVDINSCVDLSRMKSISWTNLKQYKILTGDCESKGAGWTRIFDKTTLSTYIYNNESTYISYEDPESLLNKVLYVMTGDENGNGNAASLGGIMISDVAADLKDELLSIVYHIRSNNAIPKKPPLTNSASPTPSDTSSALIGVIIGSIIGAAAIVGGVFLWWHHKRREQMTLNKSVNNNDYQNVSVPVSFIDKAVPDTPVSRVTALYDFEGKETTDLSFKKGDIIEVIEKGDGANDWWVGKIGSKIGEFPAIQKRWKASTISPHTHVPPYAPPLPPKKQIIPPPKTAKTPAKAYDSSFVGLTGGQIFHEMMLRHGVKQVFGYPGGAILPVFDAIYNSKHFDFILPRHEQGAGHMAEGYARASGKPGVVLVTSGPGATNVVTPMQDALSDGTPLVVFCGQVPTTAIGTDAFQEADVVGISQLPRRITEAFEIATTGRPGPVLVDLPKDITAGILKKPIPTQYTLPFKAFSDPIKLSSSLSNDPLIKRAAALINGANKPIIYAGQGVLTTDEGPANLRELAARGNIPVTTTLQGLGAFDELDPRSLHMLGMHGSAYANLAMQNADLIIALGARFDDRVTGRLTHFALEAKRAAKEKRGGIIHFEISPKNINKVVQATEAIEGDVATNLGKILPLIESSERKEWFGQIEEWKRKFPWTYSKPTSSDKPLKPQQFIEELDRQTQGYKEKVLLTTGVGQHQMWAAQFFRWRYPRTMITSGGLGTMGYGLPSAIGAKVAKPDNVVIDIDGDASFCMTGMELMTAAHYNIGVKVLILNNDFQGMVKQWQDLFYEERYSQTEMNNPDFVKFAESMNVKGIRIRTEDELPDKMAEFLEYDKGPIICDAVIEKHEHVYPMVPAGKALDEFIVHPDLNK